MKTKLVKFIISILVIIMIIVILLNISVVSVDIRNIIENEDTITGLKILNLM